MVDSYGGNEIAAHAVASTPTLFTELEGFRTKLLFIFDKSVVYYIEIVRVKENRGFLGTD